MEDTDGTSEDMPVIGLDDDRAEDVMKALSSQQAKEIYTVLQSTPSTVSDLAEEIDSTVQNVHHHVTQLREAGVVQVTDHQYSPKGQEMKVYETVEQPVLVFSVSDKHLDRVKQALKYVSGWVGLLAGTALVRKVGHMVFDVDRRGGRIGYAPPNLVERFVKAVISLSVTEVVVFTAVLWIMIIAVYHWTRFPRWTRSS